MTLPLEILLALPFAMAALLAARRHAPRGQLAWLAAAAPLLGMAVLAWLTPAVLAGQVIRSQHAWLPQIGFGFVRDLLQAYDAMDAARAAASRS